MKVNFKDTELFFTNHGAGDPLVLLHGFLESSKIWEEFTANFPLHHEIIAIDLPGHGNSGSFGEIHSMEEMAEAVHAVLKELNIERADFIGHSMGGYVALAFLEKYPEKIDKLILLNSTPAADSEQRKTDRERAVSLVQKNKQSFVSMAISNLLYPESHHKFKDELNTLKAEASGFSENGIIAALRGMKIRKDRTAVLKRFKGTKVILAGEQDPLLNLQDMKLLAEETGCRFYSFPGGHLSHIENKKEFEKVVHFIE